MLRDVGPVLTNCMQGGTTAHCLLPWNIQKGLFLGTVSRRDGQILVFGAS